MKTSISSDVWEKKKALIAKLYMEEEWPLKQVIKQIRSDDFNPSETQLRSRLKKWRVTKPSRQTRKKPQEDPDSEKDVRASTSPRNHRPTPASKATARARPDWVATHPIYAPSNVPSQAVDPPSKWNAPLATQQLTPSPSGEHGLVTDRSGPVSAFSDPSPTTTSFEPSAQTSPVGGGLMLNTTSAVTPNYAAYPLSPESGLPSPGSATTPAMASWPSRAVSVDLGLNSTLHPAHWYSMPFEPITPPPGAPHSAPLSAPLAPTTAGYRDPMPMVAPQGPNVFSSEFSQYGEADYSGYDPKSWKRAMSLQYDFAGRHDPERKHHPHGHHAGMVPVSTAGGPHAVMCAPIVPYMGQDPMVQRHPSVGY
ncbi:hypothetical protein N7492_004007 [Penicillium capsulatum]|uniref:Clr5 domain-containing protein n=1 Tax=Penicillium capsulatum TaxID=69766 RepID=A0A9W9IN05_9EURO|nr:hypothetical protein N7492_004007 [Penicillium capsulatum]KAJ6121417.1 hypothetical protein N7512_003882 [Penicillium capsulatum]